MDLKINKSDAVVFDLDDTLYREIDFVQSAFRYIIKKYFKHDNEIIFSEMLNNFHSKKNVFNELISTHKLTVTINELLEIYRNHKPVLSFNPGAAQLLNILFEKKIKTGLITDGRKSTQWNKIYALGIEHKFDCILVSEETGYEKPHEHNYILTMQKINANQYTYIADNLTKDFIVPLKYGWNCICKKDDGTHIHSQKKSEVYNNGKITFVESLKEINLIYE